MLYASAETIRIKKDQTDKTLNILSLTGARGETVFGQFVFLPPKTAVINAISLDFFRNEKTTFSLAAEFYCLEAVHIKKPSCSYGGTGDFFEVLLPASAALSTELTARVAQNSKQPILMSFTVPDETAAGDYNSEITLQTNIGIYRLSVKLSVYDFGLPKKNHAVSAFAVWFENERVLNKNPSAPPLGEKFDRYLQYYNLLKKYRISATELPVRSASDANYCAACDSNIRPFEPRRGISPNNLEHFITAAKQYAADASVASYSLPYDVVITDGVPAIDTESLYRLLTALVRESTASLDLIEKGYIYVTFIDEPSDEALPLVRKVTEDIRSVVARVAADSDFTNKEKVKLSLLSIDNVVPSWPVEKIYGGVDAFCPTFSGWHAPEFSHGMKILRTLGTKNWWYGCISPWYPFPSYHIDEPLIGARAEGILRYLYDIKGNLYWAVNFDRHYDEALDTIVRDDIIAGDAYWEQSNGEGLLVFDGARFGLDAPLASLRMTAVCQAHQDYEYCLILDEKLQTLCLDYNIAMDRKSYLRPILETLFYGTAVVDETKFGAVRSELAQAIHAAEHGVLVWVHCPDAAAQTAEVTVYSKRGTKVCGSGEHVRSESAGLGKADCFRVRLDGSGVFFTVEIETREEKFRFSRFVSPPTVSLRVSDMRPDGKLIAQLGAGGLLCRAAAFDNDSGPYVSLKGAFDLTRLDSFILETENLSEDAFLLSIVITDITGKRFSVGYDLIDLGINRSRIHFNPAMQLNGWRELRHTTGFSHYTPELAALNSVDLKHVTEITVEVQNEKEFCSLDGRQLRFQPYTFYIKSFYYTKWTENPHGYAFLKEGKNED